MTLPPLPDRESFAVPSTTHLPESGVYYSAKALRDHVTAAVLAERARCIAIVEKWRDAYPSEDGTRDALDDLRSAV